MERKGTTRECAGNEMLVIAATANTTAHRADGSENTAWRADVILPGEW